MKTSWKKYQIGNCLRGIYEFKARSIEEAWDRGCAMFNKGFPTLSKSRGRSVSLWQYDDTVLPIFKTKWAHDEDALKAKERHFANHEVETYRGFVPVAEGMSKQKLIFRKQK